MEDESPFPLTFDGYLEETPVPTKAGGGVTYSRVLPETPELPEIKVGLGVLVPVPFGWPYVQRDVFAKPPRVRSLIGERDFLTAVKEEGFTLAHLPDWKEHLLLELGYAQNLAPGPRYYYWDVSGPTNYNYHFFNPTFYQTSEEERVGLLSEHGFHKVATMVAYGHNKDIDATIRKVEEVKGPVPLKTALNVMAFGAPLEDIIVAAQLPEGMVKEIYEDASQTKDGA